MLFSATMPSAIVSLARMHMRHPMNIRAESSYENATVPATAQFIYQAHDLDKPEIIGRILQADDAGKVIVFTRTKRQAQRVADDLAERGFSASPLHGDMAQVAREKALTKFREDKLRVLVATDVAARGIDVAGVSHVINYTCPEDDKTYVHRIGRTGRAGATGTAVTFVDWQDLHRWKMINKALDLPFDEPQETYSTSEHLYRDLGIAPGTKGRIAEPKPAERRSDRPERSERSGRGESGDRSTRNRTRTRTRTRGGETVVEATGPATAGTPDAGSDAGSASGEGPSRNRRRRRRRSGGSGSSAGAEGSGTAGTPEGTGSSAVSS
jgi:superfamily II DNA/RNA helicase